MEQRQILVNLHTSGNNLPDAGKIRLGESAVIHSHDAPRIVFKKNDDSFAELIDKNAIEVIKTKINGSINAVSDNLGVLSGSVIAFSGVVESTYATKKYAEDEAAAAEGAAIAAASAYTDQKVSAAESALTDSINAVNTKVETLSGSVEDFVETVNDTYFTSAQTADKIATAKAEAIAAASAYTDQKVSAAELALTKSINAIGQRVETLEGLSATTQSAVQEVVIANSETRRISAVKGENNVVTINFDTMIIDCGKF